VVAVVEVEEDRRICLLEVVVVVDVWLAKIAAAVVAE
jgi:hypothetical protein